MTVIWSDVRHEASPMELSLPTPADLGIPDVC